MVMSTINSGGKLYTIGCSIHTIESFIDILKKHEVNVVIDVRSTPYSKHTAQFNKENLQRVTSHNRIYYSSFSKEFGARRKENCVYTNDTVSFDKVKQLPIFINGVERIRKGLQEGYRIALMCTEKEPADCHRFSLVAKGISERIGVYANHILYDGTLMTTKDIEQQLLKQYSIEAELFDGNDDPLVQLYKTLEHKVAYSLHSSEVEIER
jgi:hypothetical protein